MVYWPIVAGEAGAVGGFGGKSAGLLEVARGAFFFEDGVGCGHAAAAVDAGIFGERAFSDPHQCEEREQDAEPQFGALQRRRPFEIVQVDALRQLFCCACSWHVFG
jgi:hypothetical protein